MGSAIGRVKSIQLARTASCCSCFPGQQGLPLSGTFAVLLIVFVNYSCQIWAKIFHKLAHRCYGLCRGVAASLRRLHATKIIHYESYVHSTKATANSNYKMYEDSGFDVCITDEVLNFT